MSTVSASVARTAYGMCCAACSPSSTCRWRWPVWLASTSSTRRCCAGSDAVVPSPFFILGSQGSGSTMLRLMLDAHPALAVPPETGFMRLVTAHRWVPFWEFGGVWHERLGLSDDDVDRRLGEFYGG